MNYAKRWLSALSILVFVTATAWESAHAYVRAYFWVRGRVLARTVHLALMTAAGITGLTTVYSYMRLDVYRGVLLFITTGLILSDDSEVVEFQPASEADALKVGLNNQERLSYNEDLPRINLAFDDMVSGILQKSEDGRKEVDEIQLNHLWFRISEDYRLSDATRSALRKVITTSLKVSVPGQ